MGGAIVGYARVSTKDQSVDAQRAELEAAGATRVFVDYGHSSRITDRPQWVACLDYLRPGDTLLVRALDRIAGTERIALEVIRELADRGARLRSLTEPALDVDVTTPWGHRRDHGGLAQLRVTTIRENTRRGLEHARSQGRIGGRPTVMTPERLEAAQQLRAGGMSLQKIAEALGVSRATVGRALERNAASDTQR